MSKLNNQISKLRQGLKLVLSGSKKTAKNTGIDIVFYTWWCVIASTTIRSLFQGFPLGFLSLIGIYFESLAVSEITYSRERSLIERLVFGSIIWSIGAYVISFGGIGKYQYFGVWFNIHIVASLLGLTYYLPRDCRSNIYRFCRNPVRFIEEYRNNRPKDIYKIYESARKEDKTTASEFINRAIQKCSEGNKLGAIDDYSLAIDMIGLLEPLLFLKRGNVYRDLEIIDAARLDWKKAADLGVKEASQMLEIYSDEKQFNPNTAERLFGEELFKRISKYRELNKNELAISCGYFKKDGEGIIHIEYTAFLEAIVDSTAIGHGIKLKKSTEDFSKFLVENIEEFSNDYRQFILHAITRFSPSMDDISTVKVFIDTFEGLNGIEKQKNIDWKEVEKWRQNNLYPLFGGKDGLQDLICWQLENLNNKTRTHLKKLCDTGYLLYIQYAWAKTKSLQQEQNGEQVSLYDDWRINTILQHKRVIHAILDEESEGELNNDTHGFSYTNGNFLQEEQVPELLTFFTYVQTNSYILNIVSDYLLEQKIYPLEQGETRQIIGILGNHGEVPFRLKLLSLEEQRKANDEYTCQIDEDTPVILVDIPDLQGCFANDESCDPYVKDKVPNQFRLTNYTTEQAFPLTNLPVSVKAFYKALYVNTLMFKWDKEVDMSIATFTTLWNILMDADPEISEYDEHYFSEMIEFVKQTTNADSLKDWVQNAIDESKLDDSLNDTWDIGYNESSRYKNESAFLLDVDWEMTMYLIQLSWNSSQSEEEANKVENLYISIEKSYGNEDS